MLPQEAVTSRSRSGMGSLALVIDDAEISDGMHDARHLPVAVPAATGQTERALPQTLGMREGTTVHPSRREPTDAVQRVVEPGRLDAVPGQVGGDGVTLLGSTLERKEVDGLARCQIGERESTLGTHGLSDPGQVALLDTLIGRRSPQLVRQENRCGPVHRSLHVEGRADIFQYLRDIPGRSCLEANVRGQGGGEPPQPVREDNTRQGRHEG